MKYKNLDPPHYPRTFREFLRWSVLDRMRGRRREAPRRVRIPQVRPDLALVGSAEPSLTWVGHATLRLRLGGRSIVFDPVWSRRLGPGLVRNMPPGLTLDEAVPDLVLVTHNHRDHLDAPTIRRIAARRPRNEADREVDFVAPMGVGRLLGRLGCRRVHELEWWQELRLEGDGPRGEVVVSLVPSQHWSQRGLWDRNQTLWGGYVVSAEGRRVYHSGDTAYFGGFREIGQRHPSIDAALLPIGAYDPEWFMLTQHMNPDDAMRAFQDLGARLLVAMHWGTFKLTDEPLDEPPMLLEQAREREGVERERVWVPAIGESRRL